MNILAVEASGAQIGLAAVDVAPAVQRTAGQPLAVLSCTEPRQLSRHIITLIDTILQRAGWTESQVDGLAVGLGPGSWTGLRIALTTCKTLAQVRGWQLVGVPTFDAMAQAVWGNVQQDTANGTAQLPEHFLLLVTAPCRPGEVYGKIYECCPEFLEVLQAERIDTPRLIADALRAEAMARGIASPFALTGAGAPLVSAAFDSSEEYTVLPLLVETVAVEMARIGALAIANGEAADPLTLQPLYLAPSAAERNLR